MKHLTLILSAFICLVYISCNRDPDLPQPILVNDTTGIEIPSIPDTPKVIPPNPADVYVGRYKGMTQKLRSYFPPPNGPLQTTDTTYADEVIIYKDSTDKYNTFHIRLPELNHMSYTTYDTMQFAYTAANQYTHYMNTRERMIIKMYPLADSIYFEHTGDSPVATELVTFKGKR